MRPYTAICAYVKMDGYPRYSHAMDFSDWAGDSVIIGDFELPVAPGHRISTYGVNPVISHGGAVMLVEAFSQRRGGHVFLDLVESMTGSGLARPLDGDDDAMTLKSGVVVAGADGPNWLVRSYIHGGNAAARADLIGYLRACDVLRGTAPMPPMTRLRAVKTDGADDVDPHADELESLQRVVMGAYHGGKALVG